MKKLGFFILFGLLLGLSSCSSSYSKEFDECFSSSITGELDDNCPVYSNSEEYDYSNFVQDFADERDINIDTDDYDIDMYFFVDPNYDAETVVFSFVKIDDVIDETHIVSIYQFISAMETYIRSNESGHTYTIHITLENSSDLVYEWDSDIRDEEIYFTVTLHSSDNLINELEYYKQEIRSYIELDKIYDVSLIMTCGDYRVAITYEDNEFSSYITPPLPEITVIEEKLFEIYEGYVNSD